MPQAEQPRELVIPPPRADRPPLRVNVFNAMQKANTTLTLLFPYLHAGAIVPASSLFLGGPGQDYGQFYHHNSVDEVIIAFAANEATLETGQVYTGGRVHGVNSFLKDQTRPGSFALFTVTQRQLDEGPQPEALSLICSACRKQLFKCEFDGASSPEAVELDHPFATLVVPQEQLREFNADAARRTCPDCGHVNAPFPLRAWGWDLYASQSAAMAQARQALIRASAKGSE
ncbi:MAG: hypothetical protein JXB05_32790 [Myxococcaceae bacterium]|nr:hypothetical protein [Myxococcaceae bacterium]